MPRTDGSINGIDGGFSTFRKPDFSGLGGLFRHLQTEVLPRKVDEPKVMIGPRDSTAGWPEAEKKKRHWHSALLHPACF
jgi:hypothetical protein